MIRLLVVGLALLSAGLSYADTDANIRVNRIDMAEAPPDESDGDQKQSEATDYNSSRSNKADSVQQDDDDTDVKTDKADGDETADDDADDEAATEATDHNSRRASR